MRELRSTFKDLEYNLKKIIRVSEVHGHGDQRRPADPLTEITKEVKGSVPRAKKKVARKKKK